MHVDITNDSQDDLIAVRDAINDELAARHEREQAPAWVADAVRSALGVGVSLAEVQAAVAAGVDQTAEGDSLPG